MPLPPRHVRRRRLYTLVATLAAVGLVVVLVLILESGGNDQSPVAGDARAAVATIEAFQSAMADRDYRQICDRLFTTDARDAAGGGNCQSVLAQNAAAIRDPKVRIRSVLLRGQSATVSVTTKVAGGPEIADVIRLVRENGSYRISSAGAPRPG